MESSTHPPRTSRTGNTIYRERELLNPLFPFNSAAKKIQKSPTPPLLEFRFPKQNISLYIIYHHFQVLPLFFPPSINSDYIIQNFISLISSGEEENQSLLYPYCRSSEKKREGTGLQRQ